MTTSGQAPRGDDKLESAHYVRIMSIVESKGSASEIGIAILDLERGHCNLGQFSDTPSYGGLSQMLAVYNPELVCSPLGLSRSLSNLDFPWGLKRFAWISPSDSASHIRGTATLDCGHQVPSRSRNAT